MLVSARELAELKMLWLLLLAAEDGGGMLLFKDSEEEELLMACAEPAADGGVGVESGPA